MWAYALGGVGRAVDVQVNKPWCSCLRCVEQGVARAGPPFSHRVHRGSWSDPLRPCCGVSETHPWGGCWHIWPAGVFPGWVLLAVGDVKT